MIWFVTLFSILTGICVAAAWEAWTSTFTSRAARITFTLIFSVLGCLSTIMAVLVSITGV